MLAIGAALLGSAHVLAIDCDADALSTAAQNCLRFEDLPVCPSTSFALQIVPNEQDQLW